MKILTADELRKADQYTIDNEPVLSIDLMERAASECFNWISAKFNSTNTIGVIVGTGNNGGDGLVISRLLIEAGYNVITYIIWFSDRGSPDFETNLERLKLLTSDIKNIKDKDSIPLFNANVLVDAIFGTGLTRSVEGIARQAIEKINQSKAVIVAIDIPSGLFANQAQTVKSAVVANYTLTFESPKLAFLLPGYGEYAGQFEILDIGLNRQFIDQLPSQSIFVTKDLAALIKKNRLKFSHKGSFGHALLIAGSQGMMGAAVLSGRACLKSGVGLLSINSVAEGLPIIQTTVPEALFQVLNVDDIQKNIINLKNYSTLGIGPGLGNTSVSQSLLKSLIQQVNKPMVLDADAINILGENKTWIPFLSKNSILTPHVKEFERITRPVQDSYERLEVQKHFSVKNGVYVVLKGAHSSISCPNGDIFFNSTGNPGMATAGSGDVLTGIILGLLAQGYSSREACLLGVYIHGLAGDLAKGVLGEEAIVAQSIIDHLGKAFLMLNKE